MIGSSLAAPAPYRTTVQPRVAAGGMSVASGGTLKVDETILGFIPLQLGLDIGDLLNGKHGKDFRLDFTAPQKARLTGQASYGIFSTQVNQEIDIQGGNFVKDLAVHLTDDKRIQLQGNLRFWGLTLPFRSSLQQTRLDASNFAFRIEHLELGQTTRIPIPKPLVAFLATFLIGVLGRLEGVKAASTDTVTMNMDCLVPRTAPAPESGVQGRGVQATMRRP